MDHMMPLHASYHGTKVSRKETNKKGKTDDIDKGKAPESLTMLWHNVILE